MNFNHREGTNVEAEYCDSGYHEATRPTIVLRKLFELLEDYGPPWYTQEYHDRAVAALQGRSY
jgi:hypothetical protein